MHITLSRSGLTAYKYGKTTLSDLAAVDRTSGRIGQLTLVIDHRRF